MRQIEHENDALSALTWLAGHRHRSAGRGGAGPPCPTQEWLRARVTSLVADQSATAATTIEQAAFRELLRGRLGYDSSPMNLAPFRNVRQVSLPDSVIGSPCLADVCPPVAQHDLGDAMQRMQRPEHEVGQLIRDSQIVAHTDREFVKSRRKCVSLMRELFKI